MCWQAKGFWVEDNKDCIFGRNAVSQLLASGKGVDCLYISDLMEEKSANYYTMLAKNAGAVVKRTRAEKLETLCGSPRHQGLVALAAQVEYCDLQDILQAAKEKNQPPFLLLCDGIADPHNLGALLRTALLCGVHGVVIPKRGAAAVSPVVMSSSAGAAALLPVARVANLGECIRRLKENNVFVYCAHMDAPRLWGQNLTGPIALVVGSEGRGVGTLIKKLCDGAISLPMQQCQGVDSFNVSVAGGILMHEVLRQRTFLD